MSASLVLAATGHINGPHVDWTALSPLVVLTIGGLVVLLVGLLRPAVIREWVVPSLTILTFLCTLAASIVAFHHDATGHAGFCVVQAPGCSSAPLAMDRLALELIMIFCVAGLATVLMSWRADRGARIRPRRVQRPADLQRPGHGGVRLLPEPDHAVPRDRAAVDSAVHPVRIGVPGARARSSPGSSTSSSARSARPRWSTGSAMIYGATGSTDFTAIGSALSVGKLAGGVHGDWCSPASR